MIRLGSVALAIVNFWWLVFDFLLWLSFSPSTSFHLLPPFGFAHQFLLEIFQLTTVKLMHFYTLVILYKSRHFIKNILHPIPIIYLLFRSISLHFLLPSTSI